MKYLKRFNNHSEYDDFSENIGFPTPNVCVCDDEDGYFDDIHFNHENIYIYILNSNDYWRVIYDIGSTNEFNQIVLFTDKDNNSIQGNGFQTFYTYVGNYKHYEHLYNFNEIMKYSTALKYNIYKEIGQTSEFIEEHKMYYADSEGIVRNVYENKDDINEYFCENGYNIVKTNNDLMLGFDPWWGHHGASLTFHAKGGGSEDYSNVAYYFIPKKIYVTVQNLNISNKPYVPMNYEGLYRDLTGYNLFYNLKTFKNTSTYSYCGDSFISECYRNKNFYYSFYDSGTTYTDEGGKMRICNNDITSYKTVFDVKSIPQSIKESVDRYIEALSFLINYSATEGYEAKITYNEADGFYLHPLMGKYLSYGTNKVDGDSIVWRPESYGSSIVIPSGITCSLRTDGRFYITANDKDGWVGPFSHDYVSEKSKEFTLYGGGFYSGVSTAALSATEKYGFEHTNKHTKIWFDKSKFDISKYKWIFFIPGSQNITHGLTGSYFKFKNIEAYYIDDNDEKINIDNSLITYGSGGTGTTITAEDNGYKYTLKASTTNTGYKFRFGLNVSGLADSTIPSDRNIYIEFDTEYFRRYDYKYTVPTYAVFGASNELIFNKEHIFEVDGNVIKLGRNYITDEDL